MVSVEIREQTKASGGGEYRFVGQNVFPTIPSVGETLNYDGYPYIVIQRDWAAREVEPAILWCYLTVLPATRR